MKSAYKTLFRLFPVRPRPPRNHNIPHTPRICYILHPNKKLGRHIDEGFSWNSNSEHNMSFTLTTLTASIQEWTQNDEATFVAEIPFFIRNAEERILKVVDLDYFRNIFQLKKFVEWIIVMLSNIENDEINLSDVIGLGTNLVDKKNIFLFKTTGINEDCDSWQATCRSQR